MRLLYLTESSDRAEAGLMRGVQALGHEVLVLGNAESPALCEIEDAGVPVHPFTCRSRVDLTRALQLRAIARAWKPDLVHAFTSRALSIATIGLAGLGISRVGYRGTAGNLSKLNPADWVTYLNPSLGAVMCVSEAVRVSLQRIGICPQKLFTLYKGHDLSWYSDPLPRSALSEFGIPANAVVIGCNANMRPVKGVDVLLEAARQMPTDGTIHFLLVGEVRDGRIKELANSPDLRSLVHLPGYRADATRLMSAVDVFVMPSRSREGLPKALIEAMAYGRPVVASGVGGIPEVVRHGIDGYLVAPEAPTELAKAITALLKDQTLRNSMGKEAQGRIQESFSLRKSVEMLSQHYTALTPSRLQSPIAPATGSA